MLRMASKCALAEVSGDQGGLEVTRNDREETRGQTRMGAPPPRWSWLGPFLAIVRLKGIGPAHGGKAGAG